MRSVVRGKAEVSPASIQIIIRTIFPERLFIKGSIRISRERRRKQWKMVIARGRTIVTHVALMSNRAPRLFINKDKSEDEVVDRVYVLL